MQTDLGLQDMLALGYVAVRVHPENIHSYFIDYALGPILDDARRGGRPVAGAVEDPTDRADDVRAAERGESPAGCGRKCERA